MHTFKNLFFVALGSLALIGCSYFDTGPELSNNPPSEKIDVTSGAPDATMPSGTPPASLSEMIRTESEGSIEYYPPGGDAPRLYEPGSDDDAIPIETMPLAPQSGSLKTLGNPSVEIFPLDEAMRSSIPAELVATAYEPPMMSSQRFTDAQARPGSPVVYFDHGSTSLNDGDLEMLSTLALRPRGTGIVVEGFASSQSSVTDPVTRKIINLRVSMERSLAVSRALIEKGIPADAITTIAYGEARAAETASESRRVEIHGLSGQ